MSQPQQNGQYALYQAGYSPSYPSPGSYQSVNASPQFTPHGQYINGPGNSSPLSPLQTAHSPYARGPLSASPATPRMAQAYNPQQWTQSQLGFQRVMPAARDTRNVTGMEAAMPSPPPPYTPAATSRPSSDQVALDIPPSAAESAPGHPLSSVVSPAHTVAPAFPPPPSSRNRERSIGSNNRILSTLQNFTGRGKQPASNEALVYGQQAQEEDFRPPGARRAASAGQIPYASTSTLLSMRSRQDSFGASHAGPSLPGPPPGPPPSGSRSQSLDRHCGSQSGDIEASMPIRRSTLAASKLGPVPPTPADWVDSDTPASSSSYQPLRIDTGPRQQSLTRRPATRESSTAGLRERRSKSKAAVRDDIAADDDQCVNGTTHGTISQRREHARKISALSGHDHAGAESVMTPPYTPAVSRQDPPSASSDDASNRDRGFADAFYKHALEKHRQFLVKEAAASSDEERLELFANHIVHESRLRRDKYQAAYNAMAGDIVEMTRDMWRPYRSSTTSRRVATPNTATPHGPSSSISDKFPNAALDSSNDVLTPSTDNASPDAESNEQSSRQWGEAFKPCLSPIPSMTVSSHGDSSRGRAPSRWWEKSEGTGSIGKPERIEKSARETKYMGIDPAIFRESPQSSSENIRDVATPGASSYHYGPDEYPPEKVGWHDDVETPVPTPQFDQQRTGMKTPNQMDLSRLVTLPPPYPRHHPAINNSHPSLSELRNEHRRLADNTAIQRIKDAYLEQHWAMQRAQQDEAKQRRVKMRTSMQTKLNDGLMTFAEAAKAESKFDGEEVERSKADARALFDAFEATVSHPLNTMITEKLAVADKCISGLDNDLSTNSKSLDPNRAQEEGDQHPERLEKLTLLRWLFDAREVLHKEMFELHAQRADRYGEVVLIPYRMAKQQAKIDEAEAFFFKDGRQRAVVFHKESLQRYEAFLTQIESHVNSGVEDQVSAFWDIAPGIKDIVQQIPATVAENGEEHLRVLDRFQFLVPAQEVDENPSYKNFPLQYLYTVLSHAEKSTYQFIESQTNLWCLLHAVRELTAEANLKVIELETSRESASGSIDAELAEEMVHARSMEQKRLTADLQEKVGDVERQWMEALGEQLSNVKLGVKHWLEETGGWEDGLDE